MSNKIISGIIPVRIKGQKGLSKGLQSTLRAALNNGLGGTNELRFTCRVAEDSNEAFAKFEANGDTFSLNPAAKSQFGRNVNGNAFLTVGLIRESDSARLRLTWEGDAVPIVMQRTAVAHDEGREVRPVTVKLNLADADAKIINRKNPKGGSGKRKRNDLLPDGTVRTRPKHRTAVRNAARLCAADLK